MFNQRQIGSVVAVLALAGCSKAPEMSKVPYADPPAAGGAEMSLENFHREVGALANSVVDLQANFRSNKVAGTVTLGEQLPALNRQLARMQLQLGGLSNLVVMAKTQSIEAYAKSLEVTVEPSAGTQASPRSE